MSLAVTGEATDELAAKNLADVVRGFVAIMSLQAQQKPELQQLASAVTVATQANQVLVSARIPYELLDALQPKAQGGAEQPATGASRHSAPSFRGASSSPGDEESAGPTAPA